MVVLFSIRHIFWMLAKGRKADIDPSAWKVVEGDCWDENTPKQMYGHDCGVFAVMYAIYRVKGLTFDLTVEDMPAIRKWIAANILKEAEKVTNTSETD